MVSRTLRRFRWIAPSALLAYLLLMLPESEPAPAPPAGYSPFAWEQDDLWTHLESSFIAARKLGCAHHDDSRQATENRFEQALQDVQSRTINVNDPVWSTLEASMFELGVQTAACPDRVRELASLLSHLRNAVKRQSLLWRSEDRKTRERVYRLLYGSRATFEEVLTQLADPGPFTLVRGIDEPSHTPSIELYGVRLHSGDILMSRGGAPTSAFIARGNDFPGNFSHIALLHVSEQGVASVVESHIELGVAVATPEAYLADKKLRVQVVRPRADLPELRADSLLPHRVASEAVANATNAHIPYDFAMDVNDARTLFCSEVASVPYSRHGIRLWKGLSSISSPGTARWLAGFGVRYFRTFSPSDLEYEPAVSVVAEWRSADALRQDRMDNAIIDAFIEGAEAGESLDIPRWKLPVIRLAKAYSSVLNWLGLVGPVPEGMSSTSALRVQVLHARHLRVFTRLQAKTTAFTQQNGYPPPYWELVKMARLAKREEFQK